MAFQAPTCSLTLCCNAGSKVSNTLAVVVYNYDIIPYSQNLLLKWTVFNQRYWLSLKDQRLNQYEYPKLLSLLNCVQGFDGHSLFQGSCALWK